MCQQRTVYFTVKRALAGFGRPHLAAAPDLASPCHRQGSADAYDPMTPCPSGAHAPEEETCSIFEKQIVNFLRCFVAYTR
jgi:hypothetical protein